MSVLIKGMEMPKSCFYCPFHKKVNPDDYVCLAINKEFEETFSLIIGRYKDCPLVKVSTPHGRLIDADDLHDYAQDMYGGNAEDTVIWYGDLLEMIANAPTIIETEVEE